MHQLGKRHSKNEKGRKKLSKMYVYTYTRVHMHLSTHTCI